MSKCLSPDIVTAYRERKLDSPEAVSDVDAHVASCPACRKALLATDGSVKGARRSLFRPEAPVCPDDQVLLRFVEGGADPAEQEIVETHAETCGRCRETLATLRQLQSEIESTNWDSIREIGRPPSWADRLRRRLAAPLVSIPLAAAGSAAAAALIIFWGMARPLNQSVLQLRDREARLRQEQVALRSQNTTLRRSATAAASASARLLVQAQQETEQLRQQNAALQRLMATRATVPALPAPAVQPGVRELTLNDGHAPLAVDSQGRVVRVEPLPRAVKEALGSGRIHAPVVIAMLNPEDSVARGAATQQAGFRLLAPAGTAVLEDRPAFTWTPVEGATGYRLTLAESDSAAQEVNVATNRWVPDRPLSRGKVYTWEVVAIKDGQEVAKAPRPPAPDVRFQVLAADMAAEIERDTRLYADSPLTLGVLSAEAGLLDDAERELAEVVRANPASSEARRLLDEVQAIRHRAAAKR